ncbi:MAG: S8 family serine peptidase, partial [bacterium]
MNKINSYLICMLFLSFFSTLFAQNTHQSKAKYWVFFKDKELTSLSKTSQMLQQAKNQLSPRALKRRAKVRSPKNLIDEHDLPVSENYLKTLESMGHKPLVVSNWLNAASFRLNKTEVNKIAKLPFVRTAKLVARAVREPRPGDVIPAPPIKLQKSDVHIFDYGASLLQNQMLAVPSVHDLGITGKGVWIGMLDTGFKFRDHEAFEKLKVIAEHDFINNDGITENEEGQDSQQQHNHGTQTLSTIAGFKEQQLIGPAFDASFLLAKTEILLDEIPQEEDNWVAGIEWLENQGVDIVSSSLGYLNFPEQNFYTPSDMDGNTAVTTITADLAVSRGVVVVNSAGNERNDPWHIIIAPADGDSVIAVGAVDAELNLTSFSSVGPSADGRIKPDVVALGELVKTVVPSTDKSPSPYALSSGTSFSCPLVAGVAALVLSAHPNLTPIDVRDALRMTADRATHPDTLFGWGLVNAYEAILFHGTAFSNLPLVFVNNSNHLEVSTKIASKVGVDPNKVFLIYAKSDGNFNHSVAMSQGPENNQYIATLPEVSANETINFYFNSTDSSGKVALHPFNAPETSFASSDFLVVVNPGSSTILSTFRLAQNYPNPFNPTTQIDYELPVNSHVTLTIYNLLGQKVRGLLKHIAKPAGQHSVTWDGRDDANKPVSAGLYFYVLKANNFTDVKKMLLVK